MKIVHVTSTYFPNIGGIQVFVKELCDSLSLKGFDVTVYSFDRRNGFCSNEWMDNVLVKRYAPLTGDPTYFPTLSFIRDIRKETPAILHVHNLHHLFPSLLSLIKKDNQYFILHPHYHRFGQSPARQVFLTLYKRILPSLVLARANAIIANSLFEKEILQEDFPSSNNIIMIPEGLPLNELKLVRWRPESPDSILFIGSLRKYKRVDMLLYAFKLLLNNVKEPLKLVLVGDGPEKQSLTKLATELGLSSKVVWKQNLSRDDLLLEYSKARVFISLSSMESFGRAVYEAIAIGVPTVVPATGIFSELVSEGIVEGVFSLTPGYIAKALIRAREKSVSSSAAQNLNFQEMENYVKQIADIYMSLESRMRAD